MKHEANNMITNESINSVLVVADRTAKAGMTLGALDNSVLGACVIASSTYAVDNFNGETGFVEAWQESLEESPVFGVRGPVTIKDDNNESTVIIPTTVHAKTMEEASDIIAAAASNALSHAQNVATPVIGNFVDGINDALSLEDAFIERYEVIDVNPNDAWESPIVLSALDNYRSFNTPKIVKRSDIPNIIIPADYVPEVHTGSATIDALLQKLLDDCDLTAVQVIGKIFNGNEDAGAYPASYWKENNLILVNFLITQWLINNPLPSSGMNSMQWSTLTNQLSTAYGSLANIVRQLLVSDVEQNKLFYYHDLATDQVYVNGVVYDKWLSAGGSPELIFGCLMEGNYSALTYQGMIDDSSRLLSIWTNTHNALRNANRSKREANLREAAFNTLLSEIESLEVDNYAPGASKVSMVNLAREQVRKLSLVELNNLEQVSIDLCCDVLFPHTPSKLILKDVNQQLSAEIPLKDALMGAAAHYITDWILSSIVIDKA